MRRGWVCPIRGVRGVNGIGAVNSAGRDYAYRRLLVFHNPYLYGGGLCAQKHFFGDIEGILRISCGVIFRNVERLEIVVVPLNLGTGRNLKAHTQEDILDLVKHRA